MLRATALPVIASGGVSSAADVAVLARLDVEVGGTRPPAGRGHHRAGPGGRPDDRGGGDGRVRSVRVIPCLDVDAGRVVKGVRFTDLVDAGDPVELAARYDAEGADELVFLDITASSDGRRTMVDVVSRTAEEVFIPFTVGGGVRSVDDARRLLRAGADKVGVNTAAVDRPGPGGRDRRRVRGPVRGGGHRRPPAARRGASWEVVTHGGRTPTGLDAVGVVPSGAPAAVPGEILLTSMDRDGTRQRLRPRPHPGRLGPVRHAGGGLGGRGHPRPPGGGGARGPGRRRAGRLDLPPAGVHRGPGQGPPGRRPGCRCVRP